MAVKDRSSLLAFIVEQGYTGKKSVEDVIQWLNSDECSVELTDKKNAKLSDDSIRSLWAITAKAVVEDADAGDEDDAEDEPKPSVKSKIAGVNAASHKANDSRSPGAFRRISARKAYDRKAAQGKTAFQDADTAEAFGAWFRTATPVANMDYEEKAFDRDICQKANVTYVNTSGGATIPSDFQPTLIDLKEQYGVARQLLGTIPMSRDTLTYPRVTGTTGGITVYAPGEATAITESNPTFDNVNMVAVKMAAYTECSSELIHDSAINFGDHIARKMAYAFTEKEDQCFFNGDGTSTYFNVDGVRNKIFSLSGTIANIAGLFVGTGNAYSELVLNDFIGTLGLAPAYVDSMGPAWVVHKRFYYNVMRKLALAVGGVTGTEVVNGIPRMIFEGYPVIFSQVMPRVEGNSQVCALFGAYGEGAKFGEVRNSMSIATSEHFKFSSDIISFRAIQRVAITTHDVGNASATEASRVPGPIVGLITAAS